MTAFAEPTKSCIGMQSSMENASAHRVSCICTTKRTWKWYDILTSELLVFMVAVCMVKGIKKQKIIMSHMHTFAHTQLNVPLTFCKEFVSRKWS